MITIRPMRMDDAEFMFELKNYPETRQFALVTKEEISWEDHIRYLALNIEGFSIIEDCPPLTGPFGAIRFFHGELSVWVAKEFRNKGMATRMINFVATRGMIAKIADGNIASFKSFIRAGFEPVKYCDGYYILQKK